MYNDITLLNKTIEELKRENTKLKTGMIALGAKSVDIESNTNLNLDEINELLEKIRNLEMNLEAKEADAEELKRLENVDLENNELKKEVRLLEDTIRKIGADDDQLVNETREIRKQYELKEGDYRRLTENYDELHKRLRSCEEEREAIKSDRDRLTQSVLDIQKAHENEICNLKGTLEYLAEKISILNFERDSAQILKEEEEKHRKEISTLSATCEDLSKKCEQYEFERNEQAQKVQLFMNDLQEIEKNLHLALSDKEKVLMDLEKERLSSGQLDFELKDVRQQ